MFGLLKLILSFLSGKPNLPLILNVVTSSNPKELDEKLLSTPKVITFLAVPLLKLREAHYQVLFHIRQTHTSSIIIEVIRPVLNFLFFLR